MQSDKERHKLRGLALAAPLQCKPMDWIGLDWQARPPARRLQEVQRWGSGANALWKAHPGAEPSGAGGGGVQAG